MSLTDAASNYASVVLSLRKIVAVPTGDEAAATDDPSLQEVVYYCAAQSVDVTSLSFRTVQLAFAEVTPGTYSQIRLVLNPNVAGQPPVNYVTLASDPDTQIPLTVPSGQETGLKIVGPFTAGVGQLSTIILDFDPSKAIVKDGTSGQYVLQPTGIRIVQVAQGMATYGSLSGSVLPEGAWSSALVTVYPEGKTGAVATGEVNPDDGTFRAMLPAGSYYLKVVADGYAPYDSSAEPSGTYTVKEGADTAVPAVTLQVATSSP